MKPWHIIVLALLGAVVLGSVAGIVIGKMRVKLSNPDRVKILSKKEMIIYFASVAAGLGLVLFSLLFNFSSPNKGDMAGMDGFPMDEAGELEEGINGGGGGGGGIVARPVPMHVDVEETVEG